MKKIKSLFADQQLSKIENFKTKYNISSERLNIQAGSKSTKGKDKKKKNITQLTRQPGKKRTVELDEQHGKGKELNNPMIYSEDTKDSSALLSHNSNPAIKDLLQKTVMDKYGYGLKRIQNLL